MLARYKMYANCTYANLQNDINGIINGYITANNSANLSTGCDTVNTVFYGTYPTGLYTMSAGSTANTYVKTHNTYNTTTHAFKLGYNGTGLANISLASSASGDTLTNSYTYTFPSTMVPQTYQAVDVVVNNTGFFLYCPAANVSVGIFDIGKSGLSRIYTNNMLMYLQPFTIGNPNGIVPYTYNLLLTPQANGTVTTQNLNYVTPARIPYNSAGNLAVMENPVFTYSNATGSSTNVIYGLNKIYDQIYAGRSIYSDTTGSYRLVVATDTLSYSILIS